MNPTDYRVTPYAYRAQLLNWEVSLVIDLRTMDVVSLRGRHYVVGVVSHGVHASLVELDAIGAGEDLCLELPHHGQGYRLIPPAPGVIIGDPWDE